MANQVVWVEIPCLDLDRAIRSYSAVLGREVTKDSSPGRMLRVLPHEGSDVGGCLIVAPDVKPSADGALLYFLNCNGQFEAAVDAVMQHGGKVLEPTHSIGPHGSRAVVLHTEGNRIALHSR